MCNKLISVLLFCFPLINAQAIDQRLITHGLIGLMMPQHVLDYNELPFSENPQERNEHREGKLVYRITIKGIDELQNERPWMLSDAVRNIVEKNGRVTEADILHLFNGERKFIMSRYLPMSAEETSYTYIFKDKEAIGEYFFSSGSDGLLASGSYVYTLNLVHDGKIFSIWMNISEGRDQKIPGQLSSLFYKKDNIWYWRSEDSKRMLYEAMKSHDSNNLPAVLLDLQTSWEMVVNSLQIGDTKLVKSLIDTQ